MIILIAIATFISTLLGGIFALRFKDKLHLIVGFSAGAVLGVAFFDLIPEALNLGEKFRTDSATIIFVAVGFLVYLILDRASFLHSFLHTDHIHDENNHNDINEITSNRGILGATTLSLHSFFDGLAIGLAFQVSSVVGTVVTVAVLAHDFSDGINTVGYILKNKGSKLSAFKWLLIDALAPILGVVSTFFFSLSEKSLGVIIALFAGFFLYIGASDLLPESYHSHSKILTTIMTIFGVGFLYFVIQIASF